MSTENIVKFLQTAYSDEKLAALLAHAQDGKLGFSSCCCLIGIPTADHALQEAPGLCELEHVRHVNIGHYLRAKRSNCEQMWIVEVEFHGLGADDAERRERIIPLILAEMERREKLAELPDLTPSEQELQEQIEAEREGMATEMSGYADPGTERYR